MRKASRCREFRRRLQNKTWRFFKGLVFKRVLCCFLNLERTVLHYYADFYTGISVPIFSGTPGDPKTCVESLGWKVCFPRFPSNVCGSTICRLYARPWASLPEACLEKSVTDLCGSPHPTSFRVSIFPVPSLSEFSSIRIAW